MTDTLNYAPTAVTPYDMPAHAPDELQCAVDRFLAHEAGLLDTYALMEWLSLLTPDIDYRMPTRSTIDDLDLDKAFSSLSFHMIEDYGSLAARMQRLASGAGWSEKPPSRVRRHVSNIRVDAPKDGDIHVRSYLLYYWARDKEPIIMSAERRDVLRRIDGRLYLAKRLVLLDHVSVPVPNLSVVL